MRQFEEAVAWIKGLQKFGIRPGLERMQWALEKLNHPQHRLKFVHIAGTNGKGSTVQYIAHVLQEAGYRTGTFTSPAMGTINTHIGCDGKPMPMEDFVTLVERIKPIVIESESTEWGTLTEFEVLTLLAILFFANMEYPDFVIWETGLGGRLDSTNVVTPLVSVITNIGFDHVNILGDSLEQIAAEKAGIIKQGFPAVTTETNSNALKVIEETAGNRKSRLYRFEKDFFLSRGPVVAGTEQFDFHGPFRSYSRLSISMLGEHQVRNAGLSVMVLEILRQYYAVHFEQEDLANGLKKAKWPGRFEIVQKNPYLILDGAHNMEGMKSLLATLQERFPGQKFKVLFSALQDKEVEGMIHELAQVCKEVIVTDTDHPRAAVSRDLEMWFHDEDPTLQVKRISPWNEAFESWFDMVDSGEPMLATGSLYFISDIRKALGKAQVSCSDSKEKAGE